MKISSRAAKGFRGVERITRYLTLIITIILSYVGISYAVLPAPPVLKNENVQLQQYITDLYNTHNVLETVLVNPNGVRHGKFGDVVIYDDGSIKHMYINRSAPIGTTWEEVSASHSIPAGGTASQALVKLSATNYDVGWATLSNLNNSVFNYLGGNGAQSSQTVSGATNFSTIDDASNPGVAQFTSLTIDAGQTLTIDTKYAIIGVSGDCHIHGTISADGNMGNGGAGAAGAGVSAGDGQTLVSTVMIPHSLAGAGGGGAGRAVPAANGGAGGGAGNIGAGAAGGDGADGSTTNTFKSNLVTYMLTARADPSCKSIIYSGGGGGGGGSSENGGAGAGGAGGGLIYIEVAGALVFDGTITADGANGSAKGGGGGGGGVVIVRAKTITTNTGTVTVTGGTGNVQQPGDNDGGNGADGFSSISEM